MKIAANEVWIISRAIGKDLPIHGLSYSGAVASHVAHAVDQAAVSGRFSPAELPAVRDFFVRECLREMRITSPAEDRR